MAQTKSSICYLLRSPKESAWSVSEELCKKKYFLSIVWVKSKLYRHRFVLQEYFKIQYMFYVVNWNVFNILKIFKEMVKIHFVFVILSNLFALKYPVQIPKGRKTNAKTAL